MTFTAKDFLTIETYTSPMVYSTMFERLDEYQMYLNAQKFISAPVQREDFNLSWFNILESKKIASQDRVVTQKQRLEEDMQALQEGTINESLTEEANEIMNQVDNEARIKFLQMYFDSYMAPKVSDIQWRLGAVTGTVLDNAATDELGSIVDGQVYTRSNFAIPFYRRLWDGMNISSKTEYYTSMYFPPFKIGELSLHGEKTAFMTTVRQKNPNASFDQDKFLIKKDGYTYRDPGFKAINDYIHFLQWITEGVTGVVSTYLTEWDLSVYMQENLLSPTANGGPLKLYLNYRVRNDNPLASPDGKYTDDRALVFNVAGSAVSKIDFDCRKLWRPSDHPQSAWWSPYMENIHWNMTKYEVPSETDPLVIPYMDMYDNTKADFGYESANMLNIFKQQDYIGTIMGALGNFNLKYYQAFYYTAGDFLTEFEIKTQGLLKKVAGADPHMSIQLKAGLADFITLAKEEMLLNGGYYGEPDPAGMSASSVMSRMARQDAMNLNSGGGGGSGFTSMLSVMSKMKGDRSKGASNAMEGVSLSQVGENSSGSTGNSDVARDFMATGLANKADASTMAKHTGINRWAPALWGGPHGSDFNPNTIQGYFQENNTFLNNVPRISPNTFDEFLSVNEENDFTDLNFRYKDDKSGRSPNTAMKVLTQGLSNYIIDYGYYQVEESSLIEANVTYNGRTGRYDIAFPTTRSNGSCITYSGDVKYRPKIYTRSFINTLLSWWYNYSAYLNFIHSSYLTFSGAGWVYNTVVNVPYRMGKYYVTKMQPYKKYLLHDMPDVRWQIIHHSFETTNNDNSESGEFWQWVRSLGQFKVDSVFNARVKANNVFMLKFYGNVQAERNFITYMTGISQGLNPSVSLIFCEGNEGNRYKTGPESIFRARCTVKTYTNILEKYEYRRFFWWSYRVLTSRSYSYVPYIDVDMSTVDFFEDRLQDTIQSNIKHNGIDYPLHLKGISNLINESSVYMTHPIQKFSSRFYDLVVSEKRVEVRSRITWPGFWWWGYGWYNSWRNGWNSWWRGRVTENWSVDDEVNWISYGSMGLSGIGILSAIQGINPAVENVRTELGINYTFKNELTLSVNAKTTPMITLPFKTHELNGWSSRKVMDYRGVEWWTREGLVTYNSKDMDFGLRKALTSIYTRARFYPHGTQGGVYISLDYPIRNFLSILITQVGYIEFCKELIENLDFEILHQALFTCVDKCVIKANGMTAEKEHIEVDKSHVLYNYWMEQAIELFGTKANFNTIKMRLKDIITVKLNKFNYSIETLNTICRKNINEWTYNEIFQTYNLVSSLKEESEKGLLEKFLFAYLNILYNYRFFFIAKRFNKEDGTMWIMRALESVLDFIVPFGTDNNPPKSPSQLKVEKPSYRVAFYELQNSTINKQNAILNNIFLEDDRIKTAYVKVKWVTKREYDAWINYTEHQNTEIQVPEVLVIQHKGITKYAEKPIDGTYQLYSEEYLENDQNIKWNNLNQQQIQRVTYDYDTCITQISWGNNPDQTPIRWNVFGNVNTANLLEYSKASVSPEELICLIEEGADFWTVNIPQSLWPRSVGYRSKIRFKMFIEKQPVDTLKNDAYITLLGPMAYSIYPITNKQERPVPGVDGEIPEVLTKLNLGV